MKFKKLHVPAIFSRKNSRPSSPNSVAPETSTTSKHNDTLSWEDDRGSQESLLSTQPTLVEAKSTEVINTKPTPSHASKSSPHLSPDPEPKTSDSFKKGLSAAWNGLETALRLLERSADAFPPLKSAVGGLVALLDLVETVTENNEEYEKLAIELTSMAKTLTPYVPTLAAEGVSGSVARIVESINMESTYIKQQQDRSKAMRVITANQDKGDVIQRYRTIGSLFRQLQSDITLRTWDGVRKLTEAGLLQNMSPVYEALYNSAYSTTINRRGCTTETREKVLEDLKGWVGDSNGAKIYWMNGMAGTGKTTISYTLCEWLERNNQLGGSHFCSRTSGPCRNVNSIIPTLAYQLAQYSLSFRSSLCKVLNARPETCKLDVRQQFEKLIKEPLQAMETAMPKHVVIVIDALDECDEDHTFRLFLDTLLKLAVNLPIKFFLTSRPEPTIRGKMLVSAYSHSVLYLHDIEESVVSADIKTYLTEALGSMSPVPSPHDVGQLVKRAGKLFIYAATAVRYICPDDYDVDCCIRLRTVLGMVSGSSEQYDDLNELYTNILHAALYPPHKFRAQDERENILRVLKTVVCTKEPMTTQTLVSLLSLTEKQVQFSLEPLRSVLHIQENVEEPIVPFHASFPDFLFDKCRAKGEFYCERSVCNEVLAKHCFNFMKEELQFNICHLESSFVPDEDVPNLQERIDNSITPSLSYACQYWGEHFLQGDLTEIVHEQLVDFLTNRLLFWLEVLNLKQCINKSGDTLKQIKGRLRDKDLYPDTLKQLEDAQKFIFNMVENWELWMPSTPHIYLFGLAVCPKNSSVHENYWGHTIGLVGMKQLDGSIIQAYSDSGTNSAALSLTQIVSGSEDPTSQLWNTHNGNTTTGPVYGHTSTIFSVAFSPDGTRIVSGSGDHTIRVWDAHNGNMVAGPFHGHIYPVISVAFSPDGTQIVSGSDDYTIRVCDAQHGNIIAGPFDGHTDSVMSVAFSPDGTQIVSGSDDRTIRVWDAQKNMVFNDQKDSVQPVSFPPDGTQIVFGSDDYNIQVWDAPNGKIVAGPFRGDAVFSVAFSPDGTQIASGSSDATIRVWDARSGNMIIASDPFDKHEDVVRSVAFSPDGTRIVSGSNDGTIRVWDARNGNIVAGPFHGEHIYIVFSVAFSPDGTRIASGSSDAIIRVWDAQNGNIVAGPFHGHTDSVMSVAFSPDGTQIVSGSSDHTIRVWDAHAKLIHNISESGDSIALNHSLFYGHVHGNLPVKQYKLWKDGWISADNSLIFWIPDKFRTELLYAGNIFAISHGGVVSTIDLSNAFIGEMWTRCYH